MRGSIAATSRTTRTPVFTALHWWLSLEDLTDPGNRSILDCLSLASVWEDYSDAAAAIGQHAICMTPSFPDANPNIAHVRFVPGCIAPGSTTGIVSSDDTYYLALVNVHRSTTRWDDDKRWMVWGSLRACQHPLKSSWGVIGTRSGRRPYSELG